jgi:hypothetical protein
VSILLWKRFFRSKKSLKKPSVSFSRKYGQQCALIEVLIKLFSRGKRNTFSNWQHDKISYSSNEGPTAFIISYQCCQALLSLHYNLSPKSRPFWNLEATSHIHIFFRAFFGTHTKRLLDKQNVSVAKRLRSKTSPGHFCIVLDILFWKIVTVEFSLLYSLVRFSSHS